MMMNKIVKLQSVQGGPFSATQNIVDFDVPQDSGAYDLSKSYVNLSCTVDATGADDGNNGGNGVYLPQFQLNKDSGAAEVDFLPNVALVRNFKMGCSNRGSICDTRRVDVLRSNLYQYEKNADEQQADQYRSLLQCNDRTMQKGSILRDLRKEGSTLSRNLTAEVKIPLSQLCNFGNVTYYDSHRYGRTRLNLELNLDRVRVTQILGADAGENWSQNNARNAFNNVTAIINPGCTTLVSSATFEHLEDSPFWVGQKISISATKAGAVDPGNVTDVVRRITSITWRPGVLAANQGRIELSLNSAFSTVGTITADQAYSHIVCDGDTATFAFNVNTANVVLERVGTAKKVKDVISYTEWSTEQFNANGIQNMQRMFELEPNAINVFIMKNEDIMSRLGDVTRYRLRLNNMDLTNRDVFVNSPLYYDRLNMSLLNSVNSLHNLNEKTATVTSVGDPDPKDKFVTDSTDMLVISNPLPATPEPKQLQLNIDAATASIHKLCLFKQLVKSI
jgi:hypothetical protein